MVAGVDGSGSWRNERTNEGGSEMIRESGSEKKKARFSDRSRSEVTKRERSGETSASVKLRKDTCERVKRAPVRICVCVCVCEREGERQAGRAGGRNEGERERQNPFYSDSTPSDLLHLLYRFLFLLLSAAPRSRPFLLTGRK